MPEKLLDMNCGDSGGDEMRGMCVTEAMGRGADIEPGGVSVEGDEFLDAAN